MGKIRVKTLGDENLEEAEKKKAEVKREEKKAREKSEESVSQGDPLEPQLQPQNTEETEHTKPEQKSETAKSKKSKFIKTKVRSSKYIDAVMQIDKNKSYSLAEALELLRKVKLAKFDETVELHINTFEAGINGNVKLPHGTGKEVRIAIANEEILAEVEKGKINFDILVATPTMMPKLAKVARILGPRGLMPNPKNGTISEDAEEAAKKFQGGQVNFKTEAKNPLIHLSIGKTSFSDDQLSENIKTMISAIKKDKIRKVTLKSTMSPGIKLQI